MVKILLQGDLFDEAVRMTPPECWAFDRFHATHAGFQLIADAWMQAARPVPLA